MAKDKEVLISVDALHQMDRLHSAIAALYYVIGEVDLTPADYDLIKDAFEVLDDKYKLLRNVHIGK